MAWVRAACVVVRRPSPGALDQRRQLEHEERRASLPSPSLDGPRRGVAGRQGRRRRPVAGCTELLSVIAERPKLAKVAAAFLYCLTIAAAPFLKTNFWILPVAVLGSSATNVTPCGALKC